VDHKYVQHDDPGHGWLEVTRKECEELGILGDISPYSYEKDGMVYLEEDLDVSVFLKAKYPDLEPCMAWKMLGATRVHEDPTPIRDYPPFQPKEVM